MSANPAARSEVLERIRRATRTQADGATIAAEWEAIPRTYRQVSAEGREALLEQLEDRLLDYDAGVYRSSAEGLQELIGRLLLQRGKWKMAIPAGLAKAWLPSGVEFVEDLRVGVSEIDECDGVLTSATLAIAETGTIVLQDVAGQGRRAVSLLPDYHLCVVAESSVVANVPEAMAVLQRTARVATTFFSGPSATADIEMTRIKGVHGPRFVDVILLG